jgi:sarcosine/dimethylglycine N-methyltransferase
MTSVDAHYGRAGLGTAIMEGLRALGKDVERVATADLAAVDQFHIGGRPATLDLARLAALAPGMRVLDVGGGLGGPARTLAEAHSCRVSVLDLTAEFCRVGAELTRRAGLAGRVAFARGSGLEMPFADGAFDVAWMQHASMNIEDKRGLFEQIRRVLPAGGRLALHEVMAGPGGAPHYPVPWASQPSQSFLDAPERVRALLGELGFVESAWIDETASCAEWFRRRLAPAPPPPLGIHLVLGEQFRAMSSNQVRNLDEGRIAVIKAVWNRP